MQKRFTPSQSKELQELGYTGGDTIGDAIEYLGENWFDIIMTEHKNGKDIGYPIPEALSDELHQKIKDQLVDKINSR